MDAKGGRGSRFDEATMRWRWLFRKLYPPLMLLLWFIMFSSILVYHHSASGRLRASDVIAAEQQQEQQQEGEQSSMFYSTKNDVKVRNIGRKSVVILTYQRCGSTFVGQLFNSNPSAFYLFEPLDALYASLYGTKQGYNVPTDITNHVNGSERRIPDVEVNEVSKFLANFFACDVTALPTDALTHAYWTQMPRETLRMMTYSRCLRLQPKSFRTRSCDKYNPYFCGAHFGLYEEDRMSDCREVLSSRNVSTARIPGPVQTKYRNYKTCLASWRRQISTKCIPILSKICTNSTLVAAKTVRATMQSMEALLDSSPDFHLIHLVRDPRAVASSRRTTRDDSIISRYSLANGGLNATNITLKEAEIYCERVVADIHFRRQLERKYPDRVMTVKYEDVVENLDGYAEAIYRFLGLRRAPIPTKLWIQRNRKTMEKKSKQASYTSPVQKWVKLLKPSESKMITDDLCKEFFSLVSADSDNKKWFVT